MSIRIFKSMSLTPEIFIKMLSDPTRLRCLMLLLEEGELCVCELTHALSDIQPKISRHLATLRDQQIVVDNRAGQWIYYQVNPALPGWARQILKASHQGVQIQKVYTNDLKKLRSMPKRPGNRICT